MSEGAASFDWTIDEAASWPPRGRPRPPYGPTELEVIRSCPLRACFDRSPGYERRRDFAARIGAAFHRTLQSLREHPPASTVPAEVGEEARRRFAEELERQRAEKATRPRERHLPEDQGRVEGAALAIVAEAQRLARLGLLGPAPAAAAVPPDVQGAPPPMEVEVPVRSRDGLFHGYVDRALQESRGTVLIDIKSALRSDLPERYERQLQLYACMWRDTRGEWPVAAAVTYPFTGRQFQVAVSPAVCERVAAECVALVEQVQGQHSADALATPGDVCRVCEFRPWCRPFWRWRAKEASLFAAIEHAGVGWEGTIDEVDLAGRYLRLQVKWRGTAVRVVARAEGFGHLAQAKPGMCVRLLDVPLRGSPHMLQATAGERSEAFLVLPSGGAAAGARQQE